MMETCPRGGDAPQALRLVLFDSRRRPFLKLSLAELLGAKLVDMDAAADLTESLQIRRYWPHTVAGERVYIGLDVDLPADVRALLRELRELKRIGMAPPAELARIDRWLDAEPAQ